jgi:hypothetical protein
LIDSSTGDLIDPTTGDLIDPSTGDLIDPSTGNLIYPTTVNGSNNTSTPIFVDPITVTPIFVSNVSCIGPVYELSQQIAGTGHSNSITNNNNQIGAVISPNLFSLTYKTNSVLNQNTTIKTLPAIKQPLITSNMTTKAPAITQNNIKANVNNTIPKKSNGIPILPLLMVMGGAVLVNRIKK